MFLLDLALHRVPWNGDKIRLYRREFVVGAHGQMESKDDFIGEYFIKISSGEVLVLDNTGRSYIRRDLPKWSNRFSCWTYFYIDGHGS